MRKQILSIIAIIVICFTALPFNSASAITPLDTEKDASLTITYQKDGVVFSDLDVNIYRVAEASESGEFSLIEPFASYPINIYDIKDDKGWDTLAGTFSSYIIANALTPDAKATTNDKGIAEFKALKTGLYLVEEVTAENSNGVYLFNKFMVYLPLYNADGSYLYDVEAKPKCQSSILKTEYKVLKLWQDSNNQKNRPKEVLVDIYKDGELYETRSLNAQNNWTYSWKVLDEKNSKWTVVEQSVADGYTVTIKESGSSFSIINTYVSNEEPPDSPETGDTSNITPYIIILAVSGILLIILGLYSRRRK